MKWLAMTLAFAFAVACAGEREVYEGEFEDGGTIVDTITRDTALIRQDTDIRRDTNVTADTMIRRDTTVTTDTTVERDTVPL